tara:strand:- start:744 stop:935 length:192 start_codon:yes stop_codon:yes gene_type:complete
MEKKRTEVEKRLVDVIENFFLWYSTESNREIAEEYMDNEHIDYNEIFELKKDSIGYHKIREEE